MKTSRDDLRRVCGHCGKPLPGRAGKGRRAHYCDRSCQMKAFRARKHAAESSRDDSAGLADRVAALTAELDAERALTKSLREQLAAAKAAPATPAAVPPAAVTAAPSPGNTVTCMWCADTGRPGFLPDLDDDDVWYPCDHDDPAIIAEKARIRELAEQRATAPAPEPKPKRSRAVDSTTDAAGLPAPIKAGSGTRRTEQIGTATWNLFVDDIPVGNIQLLSGKYWPTLPNGFEVYLGSVATDLEGAIDKLVMAYNGWSNYWHSEASARLTLLRPQRDGSRTAKWGGTVIGKVSPAAVTGDGGDGFAAIPPRAAMLRVRFATEQAAADALLERWQADHTPPYGGLVGAA